jgi:hypothetical protein
LKFAIPLPACPVVSCQFETWHSTDQLSVDFGELSRAVGFEFEIPPRRG